MNNHADCLFELARLDGLLSVDVSVSGFDVNQCSDSPDPGAVSFFAGTHKCHESSSVSFVLCSTVFSFVAALTKDSLGDERRQSRTDCLNF